MAYLAAALALVAAACAGGSSESQGAAGDTGAVQVGQGELTLVMDEFTFLPETLTVSAGDEVVLTIVNEGQKPHELMIGLPVGGGPEWETDLLGRMEPQVMHGDGYEVEGFESMEEAMEEADAEHGVEHHGSEIEVEPGGTVTLRLRVPEDAAGAWEIGCFLPQHYESGMKATLVIQ